MFWCFVFNAFQIAISGGNDLKGTSQGQKYKSLFLLHQHKLQFFGNNHFLSNTTNFKPVPASGAVCQKVVTSSMLFQEAATFFVLNVVALKDIIQIDGHRSHQSRSSSRSGINVVNTINNTHI